MTSASLARMIRSDVVRMTHKSGASHVASCLSVADILAVLYSDVACHNPTAPDDPGRDRVILSKGHAAAALYSVLARAGYFDSNTLMDHYADGSTLCGHASHVGVPGVEVSTGSLGHGLPIATGMALNSHRRNRNFRVFAVLSDGECDEGTVWESAMFAAHHRLSALHVIVDYNKLQSLGSTMATLDLEPFAAKWQAFGWEVFEVDGHDHNALRTALSPANTRNKPTCVIAHTVKGKGVPFMEGSVLWHYRAPNSDELAAALEAIEAHA
jgi:transketolase